MAAKVKLPPYALRRLLDAYAAQPVIVDDLPYTTYADALIQVCREAAGYTVHPWTVFHCLFNARKNGKADPKPAGTPAGLIPPPPQVLAAVVPIVVRLYVAFDIPSDDLAYTPEIRRIMEAANDSGHVVAPWSEADAWRAVIYLRKDGRLPAIKGKSRTVAPAAVSPILP